LTQRLSERQNDALNQFMRGLYSLCRAVEDVCRHGELAESQTESIENATAKARDDFEWLLTSATVSADALAARTREIIEAAQGEVASFTAVEACLNDTVTTLVEALGLLAEDADVELRTDLDPSLPVAEFEPQQMYYALFNLAHNALEATPPSGQVTIRTRHDPARPDEVFVEVEDTGEGMPEHIRERAFTERAMTTKEGGTGLGTRIVASIVERHSGKLDVHSAEGKGTTVGIRLPLKQESAD